MFSYSSFLVYLFLIGCAGTKGPTTTQQTGKYSEDLSILRPKIELPAGEAVTTQKLKDERKATTYQEPQYTVNKKLDEVLDSIDIYNRAQRYLEGFTIQIYSGAKREEALNIKNRLSSALPEISSEVLYTQPNFRVKTGKYYQRIDAQKDYMAVKRYFPNAIVVPDRIAIH